MGRLFSRCWWMTVLVHLTCYITGYVANDVFELGGQVPGLIWLGVAGVVTLWLNGIQERLVKKEAREYCSTCQHRRPCICDLDSEEREEYGKP